jgi:quinol monooxygenase YgiN
MIVVSAMITIAEGKGDEYVAIKLHGSTPHFLAYRQATGHLVTGRDVSRWQVTV